jgi:hypothetical protein
MQQEEHEEEEAHMLESTGPQQVFMSYSDREKHRKMRILVVVSVCIIALVTLGYLAGVLIPRIVYWSTPPAAIPKCKYTVIYSGTGIAPTQSITPGIFLSVEDNNVFVALDGGSLFDGISTFITNVI